MMVDVEAANVSRKNGTTCGFVYLAYILQIQCDDVQCGSFYSSVFSFFENYICRYRTLCKNVADYVFLKCMSNGLREFV